MEDDRKLQLEVPPSPEFVGTARLFAAAAARHLGAEEEAIADLKVVISEICTGAIQIGDGARHQPVLLSLEPADGAVQVEVIGPPGALQSPDDKQASNTLGDFEKDLGIGLIKALFPDVEVSPSHQDSLILKLTLPRVAA